MVGPCISTCGVCPTLGLSRYWYGLPPWPSALWAWRRQMEFGSSYPSNVGGPAASQCNSMTHVSPAYYAELRALEAAKHQVVPKTATQIVVETVNRLWPFRWAVATPIAPAASAPTVGATPAGHIVDQFM